MKYRRIVYWTVAFCGLFLYLQIKYSFLFHYLEQQQLFLFTRRYAFDAIMQPGGLALYLSRFMVQFYYLPYVGPLLLAALITGIGIIFQSLISNVFFNNKSNKSEALSAGLALFPAFFVLMLHFDICYIAQGSFAYLLMLVVCRIYLSARGSILRFIYGLLLLLFLYFAAGSIALLGGVCMFVCDVFRKCSMSYLSLIYPIIIIFTGLLCVRFAVLGDWHSALLPDMYYDPLLHPAKLLYPWYVLIICIVLSWFLCRFKEPKGYRGLMYYLFPIIIITSFLFADKYFFAQDKVFMINIRQDYYLRNRQWDRIIDVYSNDNKDIQTMNVLNFALNQEGLLCDRIFSYHQEGVKSLISSWHSNATSAMTLSDIFYGIGDIASAQKLAFEGNIASISGGNVRLMQRLVETNIICGAYNVADKYITMLEHTLFYKDWASGYRKFLYDDKAVGNDKILGSKRRGFIGDGDYAVSEQVIKTFEQLAINNPQDKSAIQYLAAFYMLAKDERQIRRLVEAYYGTTVLPSLPVALQEAVVAMNPNDSKYLVQHGVSADTESRFRKFNLFMNVYHDDSDFQKKLEDEFGQTYWYYLLTYKGKSK